MSKAPRITKQALHKALAQQVAVSGAGCLNLDILLQPKQASLFTQASESEATWIGYGGSRGGAKSYALRNIILTLAFNQPGIRCCILRRTYDLVRENHIDPMKAEFPVLNQFYHVGDKELRLPNGSVVAFRYAETQGDVEAMIGKEYKYFGVDQAEAFTERELSIIRSCVRWPGATSRGIKLILTFNPGGIGHGFLKRIFYDKDYNGQERPTDYLFTQAYGWDNVQWALPSLVNDGLTMDDYYKWDEDTQFKFFIERTDYGRQLNSLPPALRVGWLLGRMDKFRGQYFDNWIPEHFVFRCPPDDWSPIWLGIDWGFAHPSVALWGASTPRGVDVYRELSVRKLSPQALAQEIATRTPLPERKRIKAIWLSHDAFARRDERDCIAEQMGRIFTQNGLPFPTSAGRDPTADATLIYDMLRTRSLRVDPTCVSLIATMPMITRNDAQPEKPVKFDAGDSEGSLGDDAFDALRHLLKGRVPGRQRPYEQVVQETAASLSDPYARRAYLMKEYFKMRNQRGPGFIQPVRPSWTFGER